MKRAHRVFLIVGLVLAALVGALLLQPTVKEALAPTPTAAWVGIEVDGSGEAVIGNIDIDAGTPFKLHAVLEARSRSGQSVYYTEAVNLRVDGRKVESERVMRWDLPSEVRNLWFTVEGISPFVQLDEGQNLDSLRFQELFHPEWSTRWQVDGVLDPRFDDAISAAIDDRVPFGTQRYQVWIEIFDPDMPLLPRERFKSQGAEELLRRPGEFPTVRATLEAAPLATAVFGLTQIEPPDEAGHRVLEQIAQRSREGLVFSRLYLLREILGSRGAEKWRRLDLQAGLPWAGGPHTGDLIQVGDRWVVLYRDAGEPEVLDVGDLCFDFEQGAAIRRLGDIFSGEGEVEWLDLSGGSSG